MPITCGDINVDGDADGAEIQPFLAEGVGA